MAKDFLLKNKEKLQFAYGVMLIVLIPLLIAFNSVYIIRQYNSGIDEALKKHAYSVGKTISVLTENDLPWEIFVQKKIESLIEINIGIDEITVLRPEGNAFKIVASSNKAEIGEIKKTDYYKLAWVQLGESGLVTDSSAIKQELLSETEQSASSTKESISSEERFWLVAMPMKDADGIKQALLTVKLSSKVVDELTSQNGRSALYILIGTMIIVVMFLFVVVRLWDYAALYKKIKEVDKMKDEFISIASHELRTPVTGIRGYASMIADGSMGAVSDKIRDAVKMIEGAAERLGSLVEDLLNVSRIEQGRMSFNVRPADLNPIITELVNELKIQAEEKKLKLDYITLLETFPLTNVDVDRFKQILINLISNAIKYTEKGGVEISANEKYDGKVLEIKIKDTGIGMSGRERKNLFQKFYRIQNEKTYGITGTGLGLWITKKLVEMMSGTIEVDSIENIGTQVKLQFPVIDNEGNSKQSSRFSIVKKA